MNIYHHYQYLLQCLFLPLLFHDKHDKQHLNNIGIQQFGSFLILKSFNLFLNQSRFTLTPNALYDIILQNVTVVLLISSFPEAKLCPLVPQWLTKHSWKEWKDNLSPHFYPLRDGTAPGLRCGQGDIKLLSGCVLKVTTPVGCWWMLNGHWAVDTRGARTAVGPRPASSEDVNSYLIAFKNLLLWTTIFVIIWRQHENIFRHMSPSLNAKVCLSSLLYQKIWCGL